MSRWKSRCSGVRLENTPTSKRAPKTRLQGQRMGGNLQAAMRASGLQRLVQECRQVARLRRRVRTWEGPVADSHPQRPDQAGIASPRARKMASTRQQDVVLPLVPGDRNQLHVCGRVMEKSHARPPRGICVHPVPAGRRLRPWSCRGVPQPARQRRGQLLPRQTAPHRFLPLYGDEQVARLYLARIIGDAEDLRPEDLPSGLMPGISPCSSFNSMILAPQRLPARHDGTVQQQLTSRFRCAFGLLAARLGSARRSRCRFPRPGPACRQAAAEKPPNRTDGLNLQAQIPGRVPRRCVLTGRGKSGTATLAAATCTVMVLPWLVPSGFSG